MNALDIFADKLKDMGHATLAVLPQLGIALALVLVTALMAAIVRAISRRIFRRARLRESLKRLLVILLSLATWTIGLMLAALVAFPNLTPTKMLAGLGIGSVAIGFAFKDIFENFLAGIIILLRREMRIGDYVHCEGMEGQVEEILVRETHIRQTDGQLVIVPNSMLFKNPLTIRTDLDQRRATIICGVAYGEDVDQARDIIRKAVESCSTVLSAGRPIQVFAQEFANSSINFEVTWWTRSRPVDIRRSRDEVVASIKRALDEAGVEIPFPYRTLTFHEPLTIAQSDQGRPGGEPPASDG
ncbi:MAG: mechanosensitive ion channel family protein [Thiohalocapsa sp.]|jgi:small-conductance mechanosensitive channel|uniref:mechanosensitive ion channel family protein n=1 Tax=Thiohalocapsa sp. TaxID=2497641 RepID=UPI0025F7300B|nr:mechanosensitive ion channel family protein [Thiohalocapsa sp.]MCG6940894.1 mechanosensitive ion channel family protein [Thiohalocapsa sp.]